jgi:hypothetical protein
MEKASRDILFTIALELDIPNILNLCQTSKKISRVCERGELWKNKLSSDDIYLYSENRNMTGKEIYQLLKDSMVNGFFDKGRFYLLKLLYMYPKFSYQHDRYTPSLHLYRKAISSIVNMKEVHGYIYKEGDPIIQNIFLRESRGNWEWLMNQSLLYGKETFPLV